MRYQQSLTIPANTAETAPTSARMRLTVGKVTRACVSFPAGCMGLVGARVLRGGFQLWPIVTGEWFVTDDFTIEVEEGYYLNDEPLDLVFEAYNTDDTYDHTLSLQVDLIEPHADPLEQMREIARNIAHPSPVQGSAVPLVTQQAILDIRTLLNAIHAQDFPMLLAYLDQMRG